MEHLGICPRCDLTRDTQSARLNYFTSALAPLAQASYELYCWSGHWVCDSCYDWLVDCERDDAKQLDIDPCDAPLTY